MAMSALYGLVTICLFGIALAAEFPGTCPDMKTMSDLKLDQFLGKWYVQKRYYSEATRDYKCESITYNAYNDSSVELTLSGLNMTSNTPWSGTAGINQPDPDQPGLFEAGNMLLWILETDYKDFAVTCSCVNSESVHLISASIVTRKRDPSSEVVKSALKGVEKHNLDETLFIDVDQKNCPAQME